ncbi:class I SAM-dependent methyltransferase [Tsukamurella sp. 8F]|uniref:O-methyltransferase n=1 Tax=unclassified Tsukamurella TaxID=2633480 RepID=UPI0023B9B987|nr:MULTISPECIES: class I SAM-dependent methyltransferase [unclassified Tsukamurella]MDF0529031.1 class I SAM-dependent methyltransferase [Tsukamurella sp. 8J]MDF0587404.1 class I SAM-dependent methyltransferase [Tsukamurella sp. 8F]
MPRPADPAALLEFTENAIVEDDAMASARERAADLGVPAVAPAVGAALSVLAAATGARSVVEVGTGAGISGLWLLSGMRPGGVLTTIDSESEYQSAAKIGFSAAGVATNRTRLINGHALDVLPRLADETYDLIFVDGEVGDAPRYVAEAVRLLRQGGVVVVNTGVAGARIADPKVTDDDVLAAREATESIAADERLLPVVLPLGGGLVVAAKAYTE